MVVSETMKMIMDDDAIEAIVSMLMELQEQDNTNIPPVRTTVTGNEYQDSQLDKCDPTGCFDQIHEREP